MKKTYVTLASPAMINVPPERIRGYRSCVREEKRVILLVYKYADDAGFSFVCVVLESPRAAFLKSEFPELIGREGRAGVEEGGAAIAEARVPRVLVVSHGGDPEDARRVVGEAY
ncbi:MAG: hypothetical protein UY57_C0035G0007 [Candidatus Kaiserbacteria bacterium GW2011_GWB1_50_17]|uniref:Uncharacterized protein n=1 Tax=Candidatus Kaiserbacteria bacterium GW2011_GWB1_50_17 TaxID=1618673 RepID=A0A0G1WDB8_9BACT|nr:MAG: hypothetical protein UY57_C0035G0007 [Candidatus Kaiserbacteria bacterium GW2011_GWB1_50_17]